MTISWGGRAKQMWQAVSKQVPAPLAPPDTFPIDEVAEMLRDIGIALIEVQVAPSRQTRGVGAVDDLERSTSEIRLEGEDFFFARQPTNIVFSNPNLQIISTFKNLEIFIY